jgi:hypothetical protein
MLVGISLGDMWADAFCFISSVTTGSSVEETENLTAGALPTRLQDNELVFVWGDSNKNTGKSSIERHLN